MWTRFKSLFPTTGLLMGVDHTQFSGVKWIKYFHFNLSFWECCFYPGKYDKFLQVLHFDKSHCNMIRELYHKANQRPREFHFPPFGVALTISSFTRDWRRRNTPNIQHNTLKLPSIGSHSNLWGTNEVTNLPFSSYSCSTITECCNILEMIPNTI
jgi:hypothetical protein